mmetsp:Transcript_28897/g.40875  ORF Transcript_28897/g.40875 Transcript_28897/m.40875 type:complete len:394 (+) Transcript_28897:85-1266(+)|eukprot:CAMPEP_0202475098 /NCGR_PEP_ID=MMETSP1360-20130828/92722_1 /ASSEMBLY_ACC=CAM_ASM_000848 /TAXON_ID=515479 /ORGANISM="Licmophora paradoxa, Strain CCMP2313" /LENGTH=393 /DNA_ID=CAMNT_0049102243 /DNA_START=492 /DNA_END=1673 /DNA_ORIENTATION=-
MFAFKRVLVLVALATAASGAFVPSNSVKSVAPGVVSASSLSEGGLDAATQQALSVVGGGRKKVEPAPPAAGGLGETLTTASYFALWYLFNIGYNIYNKKCLNALAFPWTIAAIQMAAGVFYFVPLWLTGLRKAPKLSKDDLMTLFPIALCHTGVHVGAVIALGAGAVSFAHIVKASEPVVTCALNALLLGQILPLKVYATLLPIIGGVAIASMKELSFTFLALASAMLSNVSSAARGVLSKKTMSGKQIGENLDAQNLYAVLTAISTIILIPTAYAIEGTGLFKAFSNVVAAGEMTKNSLLSLLALGGATYYAYNEVAFLALGKVNPVTHAVGNTIKRVVIIVASVIAFKTPMSTGSIVGSSVAIAGTLLYSLAMNAAKKEAAAVVTTKKGKK